MNLAFDIDDTITANPSLFAMLSEGAGAHKVIIVSSRANTGQCRQETMEELAGYGVRHRELYLLDDQAEARDRCPHDGLDWYQKYLWQKVEICLRENVDIVFEDDEKVIELFKRFAPRILVLQVHRRNP